MQLKPCRSHHRLPPFSKGHAKIFQYDPKRFLELPISSEGSQAFGTVPSQAASSVEMRSVTSEPPLSRGLTALQFHSNRKHRPFQETWCGLDKHWLFTST
ncbi:hypothetical protein AAFF_G00073490 [Aldrovandia affinis]|uniref:Uncharacterized protein n=1 Tax=Aldrovandia affinis TaxID=143900 RepID=A0AAD7RYT5_9TELE|nr:hypothetical protein AAFF_G00073490 [Aldrovandia affinis]